MNYLKLSLLAIFISFMGLLTILIYLPNELSTSYKVPDQPMGDGLLLNEEENPPKNKPGYIGLNPSVSLSDPSMLKSAADVEKHYRGFKEHGFNLFLSDNLPLNRTVPDVRHNLCRKEQYARSPLQNVSVIICFHNEARSVLLRTVYSVISRSPSNLLHQILLIDDASSLDDEIGKALDTHITEHLPKHLVDLHRSANRLGLIRCRNLGAEKATGQVLVFLDSHCEVGIDWLRPLVAPIGLNRTRITVPMIDTISQYTLEYSKADLVKGGFTWSMHFRWDPIADDSFKNDAQWIRHIESPTMAGGLFAIDRSYFFELGRYDDGLETWGGENLELSFKAWQCGGSILMIPCSRVGHIFRNIRPYSGANGTDSTLTNSIRVARVWMDSYIKLFFELVPHARHMSYGDISDRVRLREQLKCKPFEWYLKHVYPEQVLDPHGLPASYMMQHGGGHRFRAEKEDSYVGKVVLAIENQCVVPETIPPKKKSSLRLSPCNPKYKQMGWFLTGWNELRFGKKFCLEMSEYASPGDLPYLGKCYGQNATTQQWLLLYDQFLIYNPASGMCLSCIEHYSNKNKSLVIVDICDRRSSSQTFSLPDLVLSS